MRPGRAPVDLDRGASPPIDVEPEDGGGEGWKLLTVAPDTVVGHLIEGMLTESGIEVLIDAANTSPGAFLKPFGDPMAPVRIFVKEHDFGSASLLLHEAEHQPVDPDAEPSGRSKRLWTVTILGALSVTVLLLLEIFDFAPCVIGAFCF